MKFFKYSIIILLSIIIGRAEIFSGVQRLSLYTNGRYLFTPCGEKVILRGVNKMIVWTNDLKVRKDSYAEIAKTGANCVRIVWLTKSYNGEVDVTPEGLDRTIQDCIDNKMIPMVELHDATGDWQNLQMLADYWVSPEIYKVVKKHEKYLLLNIGNEVGNDQVTNEMFKSGYETAINKIRSVGIRCPLVIDASEWGKNLAQLRATGNYLINIDPEHNLIFSVHMYWAISDGANAKFINDEIKAAVDIELPFIVGEFTHLFNRDKVCEYETDYKTIIKSCQENEVGWLAWEWGPGNGYFDKSCDIMDMTADSYYNTLKETWAKEVAITSEYSIKNTSVISEYIEKKGNCDFQSSVDENSENQNNFSIYPNPATNFINISLPYLKSSMININLYNSIGEIVYKENEIHDEGNKSFSVRIPNNIYPGLYIMKIQSDRYTYNEKITIIK